VPNLGPIISFVGAVCYSTLGLFCPAVIETVTYWDHGLGWRLWKNIFIVAFALIALFTGGYASILEIIDEYAKD
jgi:proton-coupled amino acid transporter